VQYAVQNGARVSNNSYGYGTNTIIQSLYDAIQSAGNSGHIFVAAAGNLTRNLDGNKKYYPAAFNLPNIITVAATTMNDGLASFSNYGSTTVDVGAPGDYILSTYLLDWGGPGYTQAWLSGTSMAAPHVTGTVGLLLVQNPTWTYQQVKDRIMSTARPIAALAGKTVTGGVVDAGAALGNGAPPPPAPPAAPGTPTLTKLSALQVNIAWADNSNNEVDFVVAREKKGSGNKWTNATTLPPVGANTTSTIDTLTSTGTYRYRVQARNSAGSSAWTSWVQISL
jgi:subtilisin family serine protease